MGACFSKPKDHEYVCKHCQSKQRPQTPSISESSDSYEAPGSVEDTFESIDEHQSSGSSIEKSLSNNVASHRREHESHDQTKKKHKIKRKSQNEVKHRAQSKRPSVESSIEKAFTASDFKGYSREQNHTLTLPTRQPIKNQVSENRTTNQTQSTGRASKLSNQSVDNKLRISKIWVCPPISHATSGSVSIDQSGDSKFRAVKRHKKGKSTQSKRHKMSKKTKLKDMHIETHTKMDLVYEDSVDKKTLSAIKKMKKEKVVCSYCKMKVPFHDRIRHWITMKHPQEYPASRRFHFLIDKKTLKKCGKHKGGRKRRRPIAWSMASGVKVENGQEDKSELSDDTYELFHGTSNLRKYCRAETKKRYALEDAINAYADGRGPKPNDFAMAVHQLYDLQTVGCPMVMPEHIYEWHHEWELAEPVDE